MIDGREPSINPFFSPPFFENLNHANRLRVLPSQPFAHPKPTLLESALTEVHRKQETLTPLKSTLIKNRGEGGSHHFTVICSATAKLVDKTELLRGNQTELVNLGGGVWKSNPPPVPEWNASPALKAGKVTGPLSPPF